MQGVGQRISSAYCLTTTLAAQGITMLRLKVDLAKTFEKGQAYVALS